MPNPSVFSRHRIPSDTTLTQPGGSDRPRLPTACIELVDKTVLVVLVVAEAGYVVQFVPA